MKIAMSTYVRRAALAMGIRISSCASSSSSSALMVSVAAATLSMTTFAFIFPSRTLYNHQLGISSSSSPFPTQISMCEKDSSITSAEGEEVTRKSQTRTCRTFADKYYSKHGTIPLPSTIHATISSPTPNLSKNKKNILIIGDVHGCLSELQQLHTKAKQQHNDNQPFRYVILVGDLCNKGPYSVGVIQYVKSMMEQNGSDNERSDWYAVRGNHDDAALAAMLGDEEKRTKKKYHWVGKGEKKNVQQLDQKDGDGVNIVEVQNNDDHAVLSDEDVMWLSELPYTITIPHAVLMQDHNPFSEKGDGEEVDSLVVHAGLVPGVPLEQQTVENMITLREVVPQSQPSMPYKAYRRIKKKNGSKSESNKVKCEEEEEVIVLPWAQAWKGPQRVIFGHDAKRGLQLNPMAIGLDTGAVYGKRLSGLILPEKKVVSVGSERIYSPVTGGDDSGHKTEKSK